MPRRFSLQESDMSLIGQNVTVLGAGIAGLSVARALALSGAKVQVLERAREIREVGAGLQISQNGFCVLKALGLSESLLSRATQSNAVVLFNQQGREVLRMDLSQRPERAHLFVHRADLIALLAEGAHDAGVDLRLGQEVTQITREGAAFNLHLADGSTLCPDLVIGADGVHSLLRPALNGAGEGFFTGQVAWRATVPNPGQGAEARVWMGAGRHMVTYPLREGKLLNIVAVQERRAWAKEGWSHPDDPANLRAAFADFTGLARGALKAVDTVHLWGLFRHEVAPVWAKDTAALLGDAAHPTLPFLAQGANLALEDAWVLAQCLRTMEPPDALRAYAQIRRPRAAKVIAAANGNAWKFHLRNPLMQSLAHTALRFGNAIAPQKMLGQFDWVYDHDVTAR
jgi:salicylate hydroxylase